MPDGQGADELKRKNLEGRKRLPAYVSWMIGCIPILVIVLVIVLYQEDKIAGIKSFDENGF